VQCCVCANIVARTDSLLLKSTKLMHYFRAIFLGRTTLMQYVMSGYCYKLMKNIKIVSGMSLASYFYQNIYACYQPKYRGYAQ